MKVSLILSFILVLVVGEKNLPGLETEGKEGDSILPPDECWNIRTMPYPCEDYWENFFVYMFQKKKEDPDGAWKLFDQAYMLAQKLPDENFGIPEPPTEKACGPHRDGTWPIEDPFSDYEF